MGAGYAVVDVETTGLFPGRHDRVAEVAVVLVDRDGSPTSEWSTLVNPNRDLGPQHVHGIQAADARQAPTFAEIAAELAKRLAGRVLVAHNLSFDVRFLVSEYRRLGAEVPIDYDNGLCTMRLSNTYLNCAGRSLAACCRSAGIEHGQAHAALFDARACAGLLARYIRLAARPEPWAHLLAAAGQWRWPVLPGGLGRTMRRSVPGAVAPSFLARLIDRLPRVPQPPRADDYLALLDRALVDRHLSVSEQDALLEVADGLGLSLGDTMELHRSYLVALAAVAWQDTVITDDERKDLITVADLLGLARNEVDIALEHARNGAAPAVDRFVLKRGDQVVFTGQLDRPRDQWERSAREHGLCVGASVTAGTRLLVAADPDSQSGKAGKARRYGIPIVTEEAFASLLDGLGA
jgi:DNA polymerase-3 subunit epsilon